MNALITILENSRQYTLSVAEAMPEKEYHSTIVEGAFDFCELMNHIAYGIGWWKDNFIMGTKTTWEPPAVKKGKQEIIGYLGAAYDGLSKAVETKGEQAAAGFHATLDHITHHRGQAVLHLRARGIQPPEYTY